MPIKSKYFIRNDILKFLKGQRPDKKFLVHDYEILRFISTLYPYIYGVLKIVFSFYS